MKARWILLFVLVFAAPVLAQNVRYDSPAIFPSPNTTFQVCASPANAVPCTNFATTYLSNGTACSTSAPATAPRSLASCQAGPDINSRFGFWAASGTYDYTFCQGSVCFGPFTVTLGSAGSGLPPGCTSPASGQLQCSLFNAPNAGIQGQLGLNGSTSGTFTITAPSVAGTPTNAAVLSNQILVPGVQLNVGSWSGGMNGLFNNSGSNIWVVSNGTGIQFFNSSKIEFDVPLTTFPNCKQAGTAANPSVVACTSASTGIVSCATNASAGTCTVNSTVVTVGSEIFVTQRLDSAAGGLTCNTTKDTNGPTPPITAASGSFSFPLGTFSTTPECFNYWVINQ